MQIIIAYARNHGFAHTIAALKRAHALELWEQGGDFGLQLVEALRAAHINEADLFRYSTMSDAAVIKELKS